MSVDLFLLGRYPRHVSWKLGEVWPAEASPISLIARVQQVLETSSAEAFLFWDSVLGAPDGHLIQEVTGSCGGVWHAGLLLGMSGLPGMMDFVNPTWMLNCDSNPAQESTSWRLSLRASLIRTEVIRKMGFISPEFKTLEAAGLDLGHRYISRGVILRNLPSLVSKTIIPHMPEIPIEDEFRFIRRRFGRSWTRWTLMRAALTGYDSIFRLGAAYRKIQNLEKSKDPDLNKDLAPAALSLLRSRVRSPFAHFRLVLSAPQTETPSLLMPPRAVTMSESYPSSGISGMTLPK